MQLLAIINEFIKSAIFIFKGNTGHLWSTRFHFCQASRYNSGSRDYCVSGKVVCNWFAQLLIGVAFDLSLTRITIANPSSKF
ncbi:MAG: hypothetical protein CMN48_01155 [SAR116 cluster bacterium]|nr:hypothetical protein [SAR116 cluster bacterium]